MSESAEPEDNVQEPLPCELPCPKCGSLDIHRRMRLKGSEWHSCGSDIRESDHLSVRRHVTSAKRDCIVHICRCCQWVWETDPLPDTGTKPHKAP